MAKISTKSFITEIPLRTGSHEHSVLKKRFWAAKQQYNALLCEAQKRLKKMWDDRNTKRPKICIKKKKKKLTQKASRKPSI